MKPWRIAYFSRLIIEDHRAIHMIMRRRDFYVYISGKKIEIYDRGRPVWKAVDTRTQRELGI